MGIPVLITRPNGTRLELRAESVRVTVENDDNMLFDRSRGRPYNTHLTVLAEITQEAAMEMARNRNAFGYDGVDQIAWADGSCMGLLDVTRIKADLDVCRGVYMLCLVWTVLQRDPEASVSKLVVGDYVKRKNSNRYPIGRVTGFDGVNPLVQWPLVDYPIACDPEKLDRLDGVSEDEARVVEPSPDRTRSKTTAEMFAELKERRRMEKEERRRQEAALDAERKERLRQEIEEVRQAEEAWVSETLSRRVDINGRVIYQKTKAPPEPVDDRPVEVRRFAELDLWLDDEKKP